MDEGRALLFSDALDRDRIDLKGLSAHDRPDLRDRYLKVADRLRALDQASLGSDGPTLIPTAVR